MRLKIFVYIILTHIVSISTPLFSDSPKIRADSNYKEGHLFVAYEIGMTDEEEREISDKFHLDTVKKYQTIPGLRLLKLPGGLSVKQAMIRLQDHPRIRYTEPDYEVAVKHQATFPNDPNFTNQWGLHNTGQTISGVAGTVDIDIDAPEAWDIQTGDGSCVIAIIDTGVEYTHPDLAANIWTNTSEILDGIDNDLNGYIDDIRGWDFADNDNDPQPSVSWPLGTSGHGTGVAGVAGAVGNNGIGVAGVAWNTKIMPLKYLPDNPADPVFLSYFIDAIDYAYNNGALVSNHSYSLGGTFFQTLKDAIDAAGMAGHLVVAAAGSANVDQDANPDYPSSFTSTNLISVTSIDNQGNLSPGANFGAVSIDLGAPGQNINTTWQGDRYVTNAGTSFAAPHVSGAACLIAMENSGLTGTEIQNDILNNTAANADLAGTSTTGGVLNLFATETLPVNLSYFKSMKHNKKLKLDWGTTSELFNVGFQLWGQDGSTGQWAKLHYWLVKSGSGNAVEPQSYSRTVRLPSTMARLTALGISSVDSDGSEHYYGPFEMGRSYGNLSTLKPIAWDHIRDQADARMQSKGYVKDRVNGYRKIGPVLGGSAATQRVAQFNVRGDGVYRITANELLNAGIDLTKVARRDIAVVDHLGAPVVRYVKAQGKGRGPNKTLGDTGEFYLYARGPAARARLYSDTRVYRVVVDSALVREALTQRKQGLHDGFSNQYRETVRVEDDKLYVLNSAADDPWLHSVVLSYPNKPRGVLSFMDLPADVLVDESVEIVMGAARSSDLGGMGEHEMQGAVIDAAGQVVWLDTRQAQGKGKWEESFTVPAGTVLGDANGQVGVGALFRAGAGAAFSEVHVDYFGLSYVRPATARSGEAHLLFTGDAQALGYEVMIPNAGTPWVFASDGSNLVRIVPESTGRIKQAHGLRQVRFVQLQGTADDDPPIRYWVGAPSAAMRVDGLQGKSIPTQGHVLAQGSGANLLLIAHPAFMGTDSGGRDYLSQYADFKRGQGYRVSLINYLEVVEAFGGGQAGPHGLTAYLHQLEAQGGVDNVLIVGGSTYDHTDRLGSGAITFIPGHYGASEYSNYTVSDVPYITDDNGRLFAGIGRWPVRSMRDLQRMVDKSIAWSSADHAQGTALLIAEHTLGGEGIDFAQALDGLVPALPVHWRTDKVYVDALLTDDPQLTIAQALVKAKGEIISGLNQGPELVLYNGHASTRQLSNQGLFKAGDIASITTTGAEMWLPLSCYVTFYESTHVNTLAHQLLFSGNAVSISGAMLLSKQSENVAMGAAMLDETLTNGASLGEAINQAKTVQGNPALSINWALLGDPTLRP